MMEKATAKHTLVVHLSYDNETQENRDAAKFFVFDDVRAFIKRLASACRYIDPAAKVRFICAGEQGTRNDRVHWHMIIYSDLDLTAVGKFERFGRPVVDRAKMISVGKRKIRMHWDLWGKGFVMLQEPDQGGMNYVLSYCLKDQFTEEKSRGTRRYAKSENFATGLFRMSKYPPIGDEWIRRKMEALDAVGAVLPNLNIAVPGFRGFWYPTGKTRERILWGLVALNQRVKWLTGADAPQWAALLMSCQDNEKDMEILNGKAQEEFDWEELGKRFAIDRAEDERAFLRRNCGRALPCKSCLARLGAFDRQEHLGIVAEYETNIFGDERIKAFRRSDGQPLGRADWKDVGRINEWCHRRGEDEVKHAFAVGYTRPANLQA